MKQLILLLLFLLFSQSNPLAQTWKELNNKVTELNNESNYAAAIPFAEKALIFAEKEFGKAHQNYGTSLGNLALMYKEIGQYDKALPLYLESVENCENSLGKDHSEYGVRVNNLSELYRVIGQYDKALPLALLSLENCEKSLGKIHPSYALRLNNLALVYLQTGHYDKALPLFITVLDIAEKSIGKSHSKYGTYQNNLALLYEKMGEYHKALALCLEAIQNTENKYGKNHLYYGVRLNNLAILYQSMGLYDKALPLFIQAKENCGKILGKNHSEYGNRLNNLATFYSNIGQYDNALILYQEALLVTEKSLGKDHPYYATRLNNLALLYERIGDYNNALTLYLEALEKTEKSLGKNHISYGGMLNNLAVLYDKMGKLDESLSMYLEALENTEKNLGRDHPTVGKYLCNLAGLYMSMGQYENAKSLYWKALENARKSIGVEHSEFSVRLNNLATLYHHTGQYKDAVSLYLEALDNLERNLGKAHSYYAVFQNNLAEVYELMGQNDKAIPAYLEALQNTCNQLKRAFSFMSENEKELFQKTVGYYFEIYQSFFIRHSAEKFELAQHAFDIELATKGMILQSGIQSRQAIMNSGDAAAIAKFEEWSILRGILAKQYSLPLTQRRSDISEVEEKAEKAEADLSRLSNSFRESKALQQTRWKDVQQGLIPGEVAIEFASFQYRNNKEWTDSTLYMALILRPGDQCPNMVPLFEQKQLDTILQQGTDNDARFITQLYRGAELVNGNEKQVNYGKQLYDLIWKPLEPNIPKGSKVYFAPSGSLHQIAFAAIPVDEKQLLSDVYGLEQVSSTSMIVRKKQDKPAIPQNIALFGGIQYDSKAEELLAQANKLKSEDRFSRSLPADLSRGNENWSYLEGTLEEVKQIENLASARKVKTLTYTGNQALEEQVKALSGAQSPDVLHISTHGFSFPPPEQERKPDMRMMGMENNVYRASDNPLQRTGLLFAGANQAWVGKAVPEGLDDGILSAYETSHLYFGNTQLVVLSACETGLGDIKGSEGVFGLQRAFKQAGAEYLMMSLWKVPDKETAEFMASFYENWFSGQSIPEAFKNTQNQMKKQYPNAPYLWAGFVLVR